MLAAKQHEIGKLNADGDEATDLRTLKERKVNKSEMSNRDIKSKKLEQYHHVAPNAYQSAYIATYKLI